MESQFAHLYSFLFVSLTFLFKTLFERGFNFILFIYADEFDAYIVVSFVNATLVLSIGETVEEVTDSGFLGTTPTLGCSSLGDNALLQVQQSLQSYVIDFNCIYFLLFKGLSRRYSPHSC